MKLNELEALLELIKAMIVNENSQWLEDSVRFSQLKADFIKEFCDKKENTNGKV